MTNASHTKVHPHAAGAVKGNQKMSQTKGAQHKITFGRRYEWSTDQNDMLRAGCSQAEDLTLGIQAQYLLADRGYDSNAILQKANQADMQPIIPPKKNRRYQRNYNQDLYKIRHRVENAFLHLKRWCGISTRYCKNSDSFLAAIHIRCIFLWATRDYSM